MIGFPQKDFQWPIWGHLKIESRQLWGRDDRPLGEDGAWQGPTVELKQQAALAVELARVNRVRRTAKDSALPAERARALLAFTADAGPLGQQDRPRHQPGAWVPLEDVNWALAHAAALDFMLTLGGAFFCGETKVVQRQLLGVAEAGDHLTIASGRRLGQLKISENMRSGPNEKRIWALADGILSPSLQARRAIEGGRNVLHFESLFGVAHSQVAGWLEDGNFGRCETCLSFFPKTDKRQRYCPPAWSHLKESQCGTRARMRKRRGSTERLTAPDDGQTAFLLTQDNDVPPEFAACSDPTPP